MHTETGREDREAAEQPGIPKTATGIEGLDLILHGGLPTGKLTVLSGGPGTGKSLLGLEFLFRGALAGEPGLFVSFEESAEDIRQNARSLGWNLNSLEEAGRLFILEGKLGQDVITAGDFNLKGFLAIIGGKAGEMGAQRIVIDALDLLLEVFRDPVQEKRQVYALHQWIGQKSLTSILSVKSDPAADGKPPPSDYLDFMADCVLRLDKRMTAQVETRRLRIVKYRGSNYQSNECPFLVAENGLYFDPISNASLDYPEPSRRLSSGIPTLDTMLGGGYQAATCILVSGHSGTGKTTLASTFARSACAKGDKVLYVSFEESSDSLLAGMRSVGIDLEPALREGALLIGSVMPEVQGIEEHLYHKVKTIERFQPDHLVVDAISACKRIAGQQAAFDFIIRLTHLCRRKGITALLINQSNETSEARIVSGMGISSVIDTVITMQYKDLDSETIRLMQVRKSRGSRHSNRYHPYSITADGLNIEPA